jgi:polysaccharide pyruvyl transferase WcaK-like protein
MKIAIINHASSLNLGDQALLISTVNTFRDIFKENDLKITVFCSDLEDELIVRENNNRYPKDVILERSPVYRPKSSKDILNLGISTIFNVLQLILKKTTNFTKIINNSDIIVVRGGDNLTDIYSIPALISQLMPIIYASQSQRLIFISHTIGPFKNKLIKKLFFSILKRTDSYYIVRDEYSYNLLREHSIYDVAFIPDIAFTLPIEKKKSLNKNLIGIVISGLVYNKIGMSENEYCSQWRKAIEHILDMHQNTKIILIPHVFRERDSDEIVSQKVWNMLNDKYKHRIQISKSIDVVSTKEAISQCHCLISLRMHPIVHALSLGIPCIGIDYNLKTKYLLTYCGLSDYIISLNELMNKSFIDKISFMLSELYDDIEYEKVYNNINEAINGKNILNQYKKCISDAIEGK